MTNTGDSNFSFCFKSSDCTIHDVLQQTGSLDVVQACPDAADIQDRICPGRGRTQEAAHRGVGHRRERRASDRQRHPPQFYSFVRTISSPSELVSVKVLPLTTYEN